MLNKRGMTLVEVLMALVVLLLVSLAMLQTALFSIDNSMINVLRDEAVSIAEMRMNAARSIAYTEKTAGTADDKLIDDPGDWTLTAAICPAGFMNAFGATGLRIQRTIKSIAAFDFCTNMTVQQLDAADANREIDITVGWKWKGQDYTHSISTVVRRQ